MSVNASPEELEAVRILWSTEHPSDAEPAADQIPIYLAEIRARKSAIEMEALQMLASTMREQRRVPRRHQRFALFAMIILILAILIISLLTSLF